MQSFIVSRVRFSVVAVTMLLALSAGACADSSARSVLAPSSGSAAEAKAPAALEDTGATSLQFKNFDPSTLSVMIETTTISNLDSSYIDAGKIHLEILVDGTGQPVPCGTEGPGIEWVRFDQVGGGIVPAGGVTTHVVDLDDLESRGVGVTNAACGQTICIRAQYITGGGQVKVPTHFSPATPFTIECGGCTLSQGYWKTHGPSPAGGNANEWPVTSLMLGSVLYTDVQLQTILEAPVAGNGLISLAHQLIAAKLNVANGADDSAIAATIAAADALIGALVVPPVGAGSLAPSATSALVETLTAYNEGSLGPGHCQPSN